MKSSTIKHHSIVLSGRRTSICLEDAFWNSFKEIARDRGDTLTNLIAQIDADRQSRNLSSAIRMFVLGYYRDQLDQRGGIVQPSTAPHLVATVDLLAD